MRFARVLTALTATIVISAACGGDDGGRYSPEVRSAYLEGCMQEGNRAFCECTLVELEKTFTEEEFINFSLGAASEEEPPADFVTIAIACIGEFGD